MSDVDYNFSVWVAAIASAVERIKELERRNAALVEAATWAREFVDYHWADLDDMRVVNGDDVVALDRLVKALEASK